MHMRDGFYRVFWVNTDQTIQLLVTIVLQRRSEYWNPKDHQLLQQSSKDTNTGGTEEMMGMKVKKLSSCSWEG